MIISPTIVRPLLPRLAIVCCLMTAPACKKTPYPAGKGQNELVVLAEITADNPLKIPVSKSIEVGDGGVITFDKVTTANVTVSRDTAGAAWVCMLNNSSDYAGDPASIYTSPQRPKPNTTYHLKVQDPLSGTATAKTTIPSRPHLVSMDTSSGTRNGLPVLKMHFKIEKISFHSIIVQ